MAEKSTTSSSTKAVKKSTVAATAPVSSKTTTKAASACGSPKKCAPRKCAAAPKKTAVKTTKVTFSLQEAPGRKVYIAGSFNDWNPTAKKLTFKKATNAYSTIMTLEPGSYQYKFVIDGVWCVDPANSEWIQNEHGTLNSVIHVQ